ncbi:site-specific integrase, partial [Fusobacterium sp.]|uniref:tyrosine-type recombinase/integrase n=1 Tax=Fusobacterium sp. TaxID=68766 RepID=UPI002621C2B0
LKNDYILNNRIKFIEIGKKEKVLERRIFTQEEIERLWIYKNEKYVYIVLMLLYTGMRIGELINLKNEDIDLENGVIHITESKTESGIRDIPINSKILPLIIKNMKLKQKYFLKGETTEKLSYSTFKPRFVKLLDSLNIEPHTIHDTRHTFASLLNNANANPTSIIRIMGHAKFTTTENIYTHKDRNELEKAINLI